MYLLRRKADGKYWLNHIEPKHINWDPEAREAQWVEDPSLCRPFKTAGGARTSRGFPWTNAGYPTYGQFNDVKAFHKAWRQYHRARFDDGYEVVEVSVNIQVVNK